MPNSSGTVDVEIVGLISALAKSQCKKEYIDGIDFSDDYLRFITDGLDKSGNKVRILLAHIGTYTDKQNNACWDDAENKASLRFGPDTISGIASGHSHKHVCGYINGVPVVQGAISDIPGREYIALSKNKSYPVVVDKFITTGGDGYPVDLFPESKCVKDIKLPGTTDAFLLFLKKLHGKNIPLSSKTLFKANIKRYKLQFRSVAR